MAVTLGLCCEQDVPDLLRFLNDHWKRGHIFTVCRPLLDWQHREDEGSYSFVLGRRDGDGEIMGILGFLPTRRFDPALAGANTIWLTMWKVREGAGDAGLGLRMLRWLTETERHVAVGAITSNAGTLPIYARLGYATGELPHYVMAKTVRQQPAAPGDLETIVGADPSIGPGADTTYETVDGAVCPRKTARYIVGRYLRHPIYRYAVHTLVDDAGPRAGLVTRIAEHDGLRALRIVDFAGVPELFARTGPAIQRLIEDHAADYADVYNAGIEPDAFARAGFSRVDSDGPLVVPDHFEPFERRNVRLWFSMKANVTPMLFKGDADQDRPSQVTSS